MSDIRKIAGLPITTPKQLNKHINILVYGESGAGKTTLVQTASDVKEMLPILFVDTDDGTLSVQDQNMHVVKPTSWTQILSIHKALQKGTEYNTVIIDSFSNLQDICMDEVKGPREVPFQQDWGRMTTKMVNLIRAFQKLPINFLATALANVETSDSGVKSYTPAFSNKLSYRVPAALDFCAFLSVKGNKRILTCQKTGTISAKGRGYRLPSRIENPTIKILRNAAFKKKGN